MSRKKTLNRAFLFLLTVPVFLFVFMPVAWLVISSISTKAELLSIPIHWIPQRPTLENYTNILTPGTATSEVARSFKVVMRNSFLVAISVTVVCLLVGSLAAYALVRIQFPFRRSLLLGILGTRMIPEISLVIPLYIIATRLKLYDTPWVLIATYLSFSLPFAIWIIASFFESVPVEMEEAAIMDGGSRLRILFNIVIPISAPGMVSTAIFIFLMCWDEFFYALIFTSTIAAKTMPVAIAEFVGRYSTDITAMMAGGVFAALPPVILSLIFQRYIVSGMTAGAVKG
jgi:multiple sugar transport system permease protein